MAPPDVMTAEQLMGGVVEQASKSVKGKGVAENPMLWGVPGHLTKEQTDVYFEFREQVEKWDESLRSTVYCFGEVEGEAWALCRWLRARKFVLADVITMVKEAAETRKEAKKKDFYPDPVDALGVEASLFFAQYPQLYSGVAKDGTPIFISKPGILNVDGMECITTLDGIIKFHWHIMMHDFAKRLRKMKEANPEFKRFACFCILDLNKLTTSQLSRRAMAIIKEQTAIDSICFPETMSKMLIVNAPTFFAATWRLIKGWLDPRTAAKIEVIASKTASEKRLLELVEEDQLPSDYGGTGPDTNKTIMEEFGGSADRIVTKMLYLRGHGSEVVEIHPRESLEIFVYTRSTVGATFSVHDTDKKVPLVEHVMVKHTGTADVTETPTTTKLTKQPIAGPITVKVKADSGASRFSTQNYLVVFTIKNIPH